MEDCRLEGITTLLEYIIIVRFKPLSLSKLQIQARKRTFPCFKLMNWPHFIKLPLAEFLLALMTPSLLLQKLALSDLPVGRRLSIA
jgi:hypothetical protein